MANSIEPPEKTKTEIFTMELNAFPDLETAKANIPDIAQKLGVSKALGYKALKQTKFYLAEAEVPKAEVPTVKIPEVPTEEIIEEIEAEEEIAPTEAIPPEVIEEVPTAPPTLEIPKVGFQPTDIEWMFKWSFQKLADYTEWEGWRLSPEESKKLGEVWTPVLNQHLPQLIPHMPIVVAGTTTFIVFAPRLIAYRQYTAKKREEKPLPEVVEKIPTETPKEPPKPPTEKEIEEKKGRQKPPFMEKL